MSLPPLRGSPNANQLLGPGMSIDKQLCRFDGTSGALVIAANVVGEDDGSLTLGTDGAADTCIALSTDTPGMHSYLSHYTHLDAGSPPFGPNQLVALSTNRNIRAGGTFDDATQPSGAYIIEDRFFDGATTKIEIYSEGVEPNGARYRRHGWSWDVDNHSGSWFVHASSSLWLADDATTQLAAMSGAHLSIGATTSTSDALLITQVAETSGVPNALHIVGAAHTGITASTACADVRIDGTAHVKTWAAGALATLQADVLIEHRTLAAASASTFTKAATLAIDDGPAAGSNMTITTRLGLYCGGKGEFGDLVDVVNSAGFRVRNSTTDGFAFSRVGTNIWQLAPYGSATEFDIGSSILITNLAGFVTNLAIKGGYNQTQSYPVFSESYTFAATNVNESWSGGHKVTHSAWNTGGTPAAQDMVWFDQYTSVQGNPPTVFREIWLKRGAGANTKMVNIPGQQVTISGVKAGADASIIAFLAALFPGIVNDTTT